MSKALWSPRVNARESKAGLTRESKNKSDNLKEGWLSKYAVSAPTPLKNWKRRWLVLQPQLIMWMDKPSEGMQDGKTLRLRKCTLVSHAVRTTRALRGITAMQRLVWCRRCGQVTIRAGRTVMLFLCAHRVHGTARTAPKEAVIVP